MNPRLFVVVHLHTPREKYWGVLHRNSPTGAWLTGIDLKTLEDWIQSGVGDADAAPFLSTSFFPVHRIEKITVDEASADIPSLRESLSARLGRPVEKMLSASLDLPEDVQ